MLDQWFEQEAKKHFQNYDRLLLVDPNQEYDFLVNNFEQHSDIKILRINNVADDVRIKYEVEKKSSKQPVLIYSTIPKDDITYCLEFQATNPTSEELRKSLPRFIQSKLDFTSLELTPSDYVMLGKESVGKGEQFWRDVKANGIDAVLGNFDRNVVEFLAQPEQKKTEFAEKVWEVFCGKLEEIADITTLNKPAGTVAEEFTNYLFKNLLDGSLNESLKTIYKEWIRDWKHNTQLVELASKYDIPSSIDLWKISPLHPFRSVDLSLARDVIEHLEDENWIKRRKPAIKDRLESEDVLNLIEVDYWEDILTLINSDLSIEPYHIKSLDEYINTLYPDELSKLDNAVRHLYTYFEKDQGLQRRFTNYYIGIMKPYWDQWFDRFEEEYSPEQTGLLCQILNQTETPCAVIVGDGLTFELAKEIQHSLSSTAYDINISPVKGDYPSTTEHNMSRLFNVTDEISNLRRDREEFLLKSFRKDIAFYNVDEYQKNNSPPEYLILYQSDTDDILEKLSKRGLKYLPQAKENVTVTIQSLLNNGYQEVHLISDHGFVLYGSIEGADKIPVDDRPDQAEIKDRYVASKRPLDPEPNNSLHIEKEYKGYEHLYFTQGLKPYRSPNKYGFAHGGITPQELIIPHLIVSHKSGYLGQELEVKIANKEKLQSIPVANVDIKLKAGSSEDLLNSNRRVYLAFYRYGNKFKDTNLIELQAGEEKKFEVRFDKMEDCRVELLDAETRKTLDSAELHFESARDLGGLMNE